MTDVIFVLGFFATIGGIVMVSVPAALIIGGVLTMTGAVLRWTHEAKREIGPPR